MRHFPHETRMRGAAGRLPFPPPWAGPGGRGWAGPGGYERGRGRGPHHRGRGGRHNVRAAVLALLAERPMHGYEMITELEARTEGVWRPSPGSVYPTLQMLEDEGLISSEESGGRRQFSLTEAGRTEAAAYGEPAPWEQFACEAPGEWRDLRDATTGAMSALRQVMMDGTVEQRRRAIEVITEARRKLYGILAD